MIHPTDSEKDHIASRWYDWTGKNKQLSIVEKFYKKDAIEANGFIHEDGSIRFEFEIVRESFRGLYEGL